MTDHASFPQIIPACKLFDNSSTFSGFRFENKFIDAATITRHNYFLSDDLLPINLHIHFHMIGLSYETEYTNQLMDYLNSYFGHIPQKKWIGGNKKQPLNDNGKPKKPKYQWSAKYGQNQMEIKYDKPGVNIDLILFHHDNELLVLIKRFFKDKIQPKVSWVEIAFDFRCPYRDDFLFYLETILWLKKTRNGPSFFKDTFYPTEQKPGRRIATDARLYKYPKNNSGKDDDFVRMEFVFKRNQQTKPKPHYMKPIDTINDLHKIWQITLSKRFIFAKVDYPRLREYLYDNRAEVILESRKNEDNQKRLSDLLHRKVDNWVGTHVCPELFSEDRYYLRHSFMEQIDALKATNNKFIKNKGSKGMFDVIAYSKLLTPVHRDFFTFIAEAFRRNEAVESGA